MAKTLFAASPLVLLLATVLSKTGAAPTTGRCETKSTKALLHMLGDDRRVLQHFSPWPLCASSMRSIRTTIRTKLSQVLDQQIHKTVQQAVDRDQQMQLLQPSIQQHLPLPLSNISFWENMEGCTIADIDELPIAYPEPHEPCQWRMHCQYETSRFPKVLYQAVLTGDVSQAPCLCMPDVRDVPVLRKQEVNGCPVWTKHIERLPVAFRCAAESGILNDLEE